MNFEDDIPNVTWDNNEGSALAEVKTLIGSGFSITIASEKMIPIASARGFLCIIKYLIKKGAKPTEFALRLACGNGRYDVAEFLLQNYLTPTNIALNTTIECQHIDILELLIKHNGSINNHMLSRASITGNLDIIKLLMKNGAKINDFAMNAASDCKHKHVVVYFMKLGISTEWIESVSQRERILSELFGSPAKSLKELKESDEAHLPALLRRLFTKTKKSPYDYLLNCPEWQKPAVMNIISGH